MRSTRIEWTESTWNPVTGCSKISAGCANCYAERMAWRLHAMGQPNYSRGFDVVCHEHVLHLPLEWKASRTIFVNSMSDLFHDSVPDDFIRQVFAVMRQARWHRFQVLTKRAERLEQLASTLDWAPNVWMGVSVENKKARNRIALLRKTPAAVRFVSAEPLLESLETLDLEGVHWVIVGGESGPGARPMESAWALDIKKQCDAQSVPFFFKQWGGANKKKSGRTLLGRTWDALPSGSVL